MALVVQVAYYSWMEGRIAMLKSVEASLKSERHNSECLVDEPLVEQRRQMNFEVSYHIHHQSSLEVVVAVVVVVLAS